jgi:hypothetical protein
MSTLIRFPGVHMRFVPAHRQSDDMTTILSPAKWLVGLVFITNAAGREKYLDQSRTHMILAPAIQAVWHMTTAKTKFFPLTYTTSTGAFPHPGRHPTRPIPRYPATLPTRGLLAPSTPPPDHYAGALSSYISNLGHVRSHLHPRDPLRTVELCRGLATGLEALLKAG